VSKPRSIAEPSACATSHRRRAAAVLLLTLLLHAPAGAETATPAEPTNGARDPGGAVTDPDPKGDTLLLDELVVTGDATKEASYRLQRASSATKTETPIFETPASIQVVPQQVIREQNATRLSETYRNVSGVFEGDDFGSQRSDERPYIRGFPSRSIYRDGFPVRDVGPQDMANVERVEVVKGPASMLYGLMEPGGVVNVVTKKPLLEYANTVEQQFGSFDWYRTTLDSTGPILEDRSLLYRFNFAYTDSGSFRDFVSGDRVFVAPVLTWQATEDTQLTIEGSLSWAHKVFDSGVAFDFQGNPVAPISTFLGEPSLPQNRVRDAFVSAYLTHRATDWLLLRSVFTFADYDLDFEALIPGAPTSPENTVASFFYDIQPQRSAYGLINEAVADFSVWSTEHVALAGIDLQRETFHNPIDIGIAPPVVRSIVNPQYGPIPPFAFSISGNFLGTTDWIGVYLQDQISLLADGSLKLLLGGRFDYVDFSQHEFGTPDSADTSEYDDAFTGRAGLLYEIVHELAMYASVSQSFLPPPNGSTTFDGQTLDPETGLQYEVGWKLRALGDRLTATLALYDLTKEDVGITDPRNPEFSLNGGKLRSRGVEVDVLGQITEQWNVIASYAFTDTDVVSSDILPVGKPFRNVPQNSGSVWLWYELPPFGSYGQLALGTGAVAVEARPGDDENTFNLPGYARMDAAVAWRRALSAGTRLRAQLNVNNVTDVEYYTVSNFTSAVEPGSPVRLVGSVALEF